MHIPPPTDIAYPVRLNRYLALAGVVTRRKADTLIAAGQVLVNGKKVELGTRVNQDDIVEVRDFTPADTAYQYVAYYKPRNIITHSPQASQRSIDEIVNLKGLFPMGRLDKMSEGLIILTDDGRVTERLLHPRFAHEKEYQVTVQEFPPQKTPVLLEAGIFHDGEHLAAKRVTLTGPHTLTIILTQGRKHQIRRMLESLHMTVTRLLRVRIMDVHLGALKPGEYRALTGHAKKAFLQQLGLK